MRGPSMRTPPSRPRRSTGARRLVAAAALGLVVGGCAWTRLQAPVKAPPGLLFTRWTVPLQIDDDGRGARRPPLSELKRATGRVHYLREPVFLRTEVASWGRAAVAGIAREAGIRTVHHADLRFISVMQTYSQVEVVVYGE